MKRTKLIIAFVLLIALCMSGCSSSRKYSKDFKVKISKAGTYNTTDVSEYYQSINYEFKSKDNIVFEYTATTAPANPEWFTIKYKAAVKGDIEENKDILDTSTNERYNTVKYTINAIPETGGDTETFTVTEYIYSSSEKCYVVLKDTEWKTVWHADLSFDIVEDTFTYYYIYK